MIKYEQAKETALTADKAIDSVLEYKDAYVFYNSKARGNDAEDNEIVIKKDSGKIVGYTEYIMTTEDNDEPIRRKF